MLRQKFPTLRVIHRIGCASAGDGGLCASGIASLCLFIAVFAEIRN